MSKNKLSGKELSTRDKSFLSNHKLIIEQQSKSPKVSHFSSTLSGSRAFNDIYKNEDSIEIYKSKAKFKKPMLDKIHLHNKTEFEIKHKLNHISPIAKNKMHLKIEDTLNKNLNLDHQ